MIDFVPGDPVDVIAGDFATETQRAELREKLGLNENPVKRIINYYTGVLQGDLGQSLISGQKVSSLIGERLWPTAELAIFSLLLAVWLSIPLGVLSAIRARSITDYLSMSFSLLGVSIPNFWLGPLLILFFSIYLGWFPVSGRGGAAHLILPVLTLGTSLAGVLTRMTRTSVLENLKEDYVRTARAKGLREKNILFRHVLRNASLPVVTILSLQFGVLLTGTIITEKIFDWPGLGTLMIEALQSRDYPVVQGCVFLFSSSYLLVNLLADVLYTLLDPRIRLVEES